MGPARGTPPTSATSASRPSSVRGPRSAPRLAPWAGLTRLWLAAEKETFGEEREVVRVEAFNQFVEWFGPIKDGSSGPPALLERVRTTLSQRYSLHHWPHTHITL